ncbi:MAG TPA: hypothetical protein ENH94_11980 [Phycisphaerales bacterium]|nr:hypothetical protein [Phycisphaerales bacterium]
MNQKLFESCLNIDCQAPEQDLTESLSSLPTDRGVLLFADENNRPVQLLITANIRRTALARLSSKDSETRSKKTDITAITRKIFYLPCYCNFKSALKHYRIARAIYHDTYQEFAKYGRQSYAVIDPSSNWPFFSIVSKPTASQHKKVFGPFPSRKAASVFVQALHEIFSICRMPELVDSPEKAKSCPYLQMKTCPAPCSDNITRAEYLQQVNAAIGAASGNLAPYKDQLRRTMKSLAENMQFEQAQSAKNRLRQLETLSKNTYSWITDLSDLAILHIDRSAKIAEEGKRRKIRTYAPFLIRSGHIIELDDFRIEKIEKLHRSLTNCLQNAPRQIPAKQLAEELALTTCFLYRNKRPGIWLNCSRRSAGEYTIPTAEDIRSAIEQMENPPANSHHNTANTGR